MIATALLATSRFGVEIGRAEWLGSGRKTCGSDAIETHAQANGGFNPKRQRIRRGRRRSHRERLRRARGNLRYATQWLIPIGWLRRVLIARRIRLRIVFRCEWREPAGTRVPFRRAHNAQSFAGWIKKLQRRRIAFL